MQKVKFGFIGAGSIAKKALYPALKNSQFGEIYAVAGKDAERAKSLDRKSTRLNSSHIPLSRMPSSA